MHAEKCILNQIYWLAYVSSKKWENMITPSQKKLVKVGLMRRTSQESHFLCMLGWWTNHQPSTINLCILGISDSIFLGEANSDIFWSKQVNNGKHQQQCATTQCHLLPVTSSFKCNSSKMPREGSTICQWCVRRSQQSPEDIGPKPRPKAWLPNSISSVNRDKIWNGVKTKTPA